MAKSLQEARGSLMADIKTLNNLLNSLGETWGKVGSRFQGEGWALRGPGVSCSLVLLLDSHPG